MWEQGEEAGCWNLIFQDSKWLEIEEVEKLLRRLQGQVIKRGAEEAMVKQLVDFGYFPLAL